MNEYDAMVVDTALKIFADMADPQETIAADDDGWKKRLWQTLEENGLTLAWVSEELGGSGLGLSGGFGIAGASGRCALAVPLVETLLAGWLLEKGGIAAPPGPMSVAPARPGDKVVVDSDGTLRGRARAVPFGHDAEHFAVLAVAGDKFRIALVAARDCRIVPGVNLAGDTLDTISLDGVKPIVIAAAPDDFTQANLLVQGSVLRSLQIANGLQTILDRTVLYAGERSAFGRSIGKFQSVQNSIARLAGEVAAASAVATSAADAAAAEDTPWEAYSFEGIAAKIRSAEAAEQGILIAHQVHGAIGLTTEHVLHRFTLRLLSWREDFGCENYWAVLLGNQVAAQGAEQLWPLIASR